VSKTIFLYRLEFSVGRAQAVCMQPIVFKDDAQILADIEARLRPNAAASAHVPCLEHSASRIR
jgi:hypothetical protein